MAKMCDGLGAILKNSAHQAIVSGRKIISGAKDLYDHAMASLYHDAKVTRGEESIRQFLFVPATNIKRSYHNRYHHNEGHPEDICKPVHWNTIPCEDQRPLLLLRCLYLKLSL